MISVSLKKRSALLSIFFLLFLSMSGENSGMVLCIQSGGHIEFESAVEGCCDAPQVHTPSAAIACDSREADDHHCDSCVDIPLSGIENCVGAGHGQGFSGNMPANSIASRTFPGHWATVASMPGSQHLKTRHFASVRSVTLRI